MRILVTGSAGFVGYHLCRRLLDDGHSVYGVDSLVPYYDVALKHARHARLEGPGFTAHIQDVADMPAMAAVLAAAQPDMVVHLAAQAGVRYALDHPEAYVSANMVGTFNLLELVRQAPVRHFLMASTSSAYGASTAMPFRETDAADTPLNIYAASKRSAELMGHCYAHLWRQPVTAFRFFTVYGPWGRPDMALFKFTAAALRGEAIELYGEGEMARDFTYIDDLVEAITRLMDVPPPDAGVAPFRVVNIGHGAPVGLLEFVAEIERAVGRPIRRDLRPIQPGEVPRTWSDSSLLESLTGFRPSTPVSVGVPRFVAWFREHYGV